MVADILKYKGLLTDHDDRTEALFLKITQWFTTRSGIQRSRTVGRLKIIKIMMKGLLRMMLRQIANLLQIRATLKIKLVWTRGKGFTLKKKYRS